MWTGSPAHATPGRKITCIEPFHPGTAYPGIWERISSDKRERVGAGRSPWFLSWGASTRDWLHTGWGKKRGTFFPLSLVIESGLCIPVKVLPILMLRREAGSASFSQCIVTGDALPGSLNHGKTPLQITCSLTAVPETSQCFISVQTEVCCPYGICRLICVSLSESSGLKRTQAYRASAIIATV